jgi:hypothetical protein
MHQRTSLFGGGYFCIPVLEAPGSIFGSALACPEPFCGSLIRFTLMMM